MALPRALRNPVFGVYLPHSRKGCPMRFAAVAVAALVCSTVYAASPAITAPPRTDAKWMMVINPLAPAPPPVVYVLVTNFPETQPVSGTVSVGNLPAVQTVGGTVNVGNLPLDAGGAVRVAGAPATASPIVMHELFSGTLTGNSGNPPCSQSPGYCVDIPASGIDTTGYSKIGAYVQGTPSNGNGWILYSLSWRWAADEPFANLTEPFVAPGNNNTNVWYSQACRGEYPSRLVCPNIGGEVSVHVEWYSTNVTNVRIYLIP